MNSLLLTAVFAGSSCSKQKGQDFQYCADHLVPHGLWKKSASVYIIIQDTGHAKKLNWRYMHKWLSSIEKWLLLLYFSLFRLKT